MIRGKQLHITKILLLLVLSPVLLLAGFSHHHGERSVLPQGEHDEHCVHTFDQQHDHENDLCLFCKTLRSTFVSPPSATLYTFKHVQKLYLSDVRILTALLPGSPSSRAPPRV